MPRLNEILLIGVLLAVIYSIKFTDALTSNAHIESAEAKCERYFDDENGKKYIQCLNDATNQSESAMIETTNPYMEK